MGLAAPLTDVPDVLLASTAVPSFHGTPEQPATHPEQPVTHHQGHAVQHEDRGPEAVSSLPPLDLKPMRMDTTDRPHQEISDGSPTTPSTDTSAPFIPVAVTVPPQLDIPSPSSAAPANDGGGISPGSLPSELAVQQMALTNSSNPIVPPLPEPARSPTAVQSALPGMAAPDRGEVKLALNLLRPRQQSETDRQEVDPHTHLMLDAADLEQRHPPLGESKSTSFMGGLPRKPPQNRISHDGAEADGTRLAKAPLALPVTNNLFAKSHEGKAQGKRPGTANPKLAMQAVSDVAPASIISAKRHEQSLDGQMGNSAVAAADPEDDGSMLFQTRVPPVPRPASAQIGVAKSVPELKNEDTLQSMSSAGDVVSSSCASIPEGGKDPKTQGAKKTPSQSVRLQAKRPGYRYTE
eukprot:gene23931-29037_t